MADTPALLPTPPGTTPRDRLVAFLTEHRTEVAIGVFGVCGGILLGWKLAGGAPLDTVPPQPEIRFVEKPCIECAEKENRRKVAGRAASSPPVGSAPSPTVIGGAGLSTMAAEAAAAPVGEPVPADQGGPLSPDAVADVVSSWDPLVVVSPPRQFSAYQEGTRVEDAIEDAVETSVGDSSIPSDQWS